jgi:hypothetical protein
LDRFARHPLSALKAALDTGIIVIATAAVYRNCGGARSRDCPARASHGARRDRRFGRQRQKNDSGMAPQAIEIAQNGLGAGDPPARDR